MTADELVARVRAHPALSSVPAVQIDDTLARLGAAWIQAHDADERRAVLSEQIGASALPALRLALSEARQVLDDQVTADLIADIAAAFGRSPLEGWRAWITAVATAVARFRFTSGLVLANQPIDWPAERQPAVASIRRALRCMVQSRWDEVDDAVALFAAEESFSPWLKAQALTLQAQLELWRFSEQTRAERLLEQASALAPSDHVVLATLGDLRVEQGRSEEAQPYFQRAIEVAPRESNGYIGFGELAEKEQRVEDAHSWYRRAIAEAGRDSTGFDRLVRLLIRTGAWRADPSEVDELLARRCALDPTGDYDIFLTVGDTCVEMAGTSEQDAWYLDQAAVWFEKARAQHPDWPRAYASLAELHKSRGDLRQAEAFGRQAVAADPDCPAGYFFLGRLFGEQERWAEMAETYQRFPPRPHRWTLFARTYVGRALAAQGRRGEASQQMLTVLREEAPSGQEQVFAKPALEELADSCYRSHGESALAREIFDAILDIEGESYRPRYHSQLAEMWAALGSHDAAIEEFDKAIQAAPRDAVAHRSRSDSLLALGRFEDARVDILRAFDIDHDDERRRDRLGTLANTQGNRAYERGAYAEAVAFYQQAIDLEPQIAVYYSNMSLAYEGLATEAQTGNVPDPSDAASTCLTLARDALAKAVERSAEGRYSDRLDRLKRRLKTVNTFGARVLDWVNVVTPVVADVALDLVPLVSGSGSNGLSVEIESEIGISRLAVQEAHGVPGPGIRLRGNEGLSPGTFVISVNETPVELGTMNADGRFWSGTLHELEAAGVSGDEATDPITRASGYWVAREDWAATEALDAARLWPATRYLVRAVQAVIRRNIADFVGHQDVARLLTASRDAVAERIRMQPAAVSTLTNVCKALLAEGASIGPFDRICQLFASLFDDDVRPGDIAERVRLLPGIRESLPGRDGRAYLRAGERFEDEIRRSLYRQARRTVLAMAADRCQETLSSIREAVTAEGARLALVVADPAIRPFVRRLVELEFPNLPVLAVAETGDAGTFVTRQIDLDLSALPAESSPSVDAGARGTASARAAAVRAPQPAATPSVRVQVSALAISEAAAGARVDELQPQLDAMRDELFQELGILVPRVQVEPSASIPPQSCWLSINDDAEGVEVNPAEVTLLVKARIRSAAAAFQTDAVTRRMLDSIEPAMPDLVRFALERFGLATIGQVLRHLLADEVSIKDLGTILESLLCLDGSSDVDQSRFIVFTAYAEPVAFDALGRGVRELPAWMLAEQVRVGLRRQISHKHNRGNSSLLAYLLDPAIEARLVRSVVRPLSAGERDSLITAVRDEVDTTTRPGAVLLTGIDVRAILGELLRDALPGLAVLSYQELTPDLNITPVARIYWSQPDESAAEARPRVDVG